MSTWVPTPRMYQSQPHNSLGVLSHEQHQQHGSRSGALLLCFAVLVGLRYHMFCRGRVQGLSCSNDAHSKVY